MTVAPVLAADSGVTIQSDLLGNIVVSTVDLLEFPQGLYGFPDCHAFALLPAPREGLYWLQSCEFKALAFVMVDPFVHFTGFNIDLSNAELSRLGTTEPTDILVLAIVTMPSERGLPLTANLQAPVLFNVRDRRAFQAIRSEDGNGIREPFFVQDESVAVA